LETPLKDPIITKDDNKHWLTLTFNNNGHSLRVIALYNNNTASLSDHPYDAPSGNEIIRNEITPQVNKNTVLLMDANQTEDDTKYRSPPHPTHVRNALNDLRDEFGLVNAVTNISPIPQFTYTKGQLSSTIDHILVPRTFADEYRIHDAGLAPTNFQPALDDAPTANDATPSPDPAFAKYDPSLLTFLPLPLWYSRSSLPTLLRPNLSLKQK
jgi:hypothetical protein